MSWLVVSQSRTCSSKTYVFVAAVGPSDEIHILELDLRSRYRSLSRYKVVTTWMGDCLL